MRYEVLVCSGHQLDLREDLRELPSVKISAEPDDQVTSLGARAQSDFGADWPWRYNQFVTEPDSDGRRYQAPFRTYTDPSGVLQWRKYNLEGVTVADVERAASEGLFQGDPHALLIEEPLGGDGVLPVWDDFYRLLQMLATVGGGVVALREGAKGLQAILSDFGRQWEARNAMPNEFLATILEREVWDYGRLARFLDLNLATVLKMLEYLGYAKDEAEPRLYRRSHNPEKEALRQRIVKDFMYDNDPADFRADYWRYQGREPPPFDN